MDASRILDSLMDIERDFRRRFDAHADPDEMRWVIHPETFSRLEFHLRSYEFCRMTAPAVIQRVFDDSLDRLFDSTVQRLPAASPYSLLGIPVILDARQERGVINIMLRGPRFDLPIT